MQSTHSPDKENAYQVSIHDIDYKLSHKLGQGAFGEVYKGTMTGKKQPLAVKIINLEQHKLSYCEHEKEIMSKLSQTNTPNVISLHGYCQTELEYALCIDYAERGSLAKNLQKLDEYLQISIMLDTVNGLEFIHEENIIHRDIKPGNILLTENFTAKLGDFGSARHLETDKPCKIGGTRLYSAPEILLKKSHYTKKADVYSLGLTFFCIMKKDENPYPTRDMSKIMSGLKNKLTVSIPAEWPEYTKSAISEALRHDPEKRSTAVETKKLLLQ